MRKKSYDFTDRTVKKNILKTSLDLNEKWKTFLHDELRKFAAEHPSSKFNIICWIDDLDIDTVHEINDYLAENECKELLKTGGQIIGKSRTQFYKITKKEVL